MRIVEIFRSFQGEGYQTGRDVVFVRFGGCNLNCSWCDSPWQKFGHLSLSEVLNYIVDLGSSSVILTGGEPTIQPEFSRLCRNLSEMGYWVGIETNGLREIDEETRKWINWISVSPKIAYFEKYQQDKMLSLANEVRIVVDDSPKKEMLKFIQDVPRLIASAHYYLSPCELNGEKAITSSNFNFNINDTLDLLSKINHIQTDYHWKLSVQSHKLAGIR